eukprot:756786-Hanusia_phi.AAC.5
MQRRLIIIFVYCLLNLNSAQCATELSECPTACNLRTLSGFVKFASATESSSAHLVETNDTVVDLFRFVSVAVPNLVRLETSSSNSTLIGFPTDGEIWDALCSVQQLGGRVARLYVFSFCEDPALCHFYWNASSAKLQHSEQWFERLDAALEIASTLGIRLQIPFMNMAQIQTWGGVASLCSWANVDPQNFFDDVIVQQMYQYVVETVVLRKNTRTGIIYRDDPAIFGWELGACVYVCMCVCSVELTGVFQGMSFSLRPVAICSSASRIRSWLTFPAFLSAGQIQPPPGSGPWTPTTSSSTAVSRRTWAFLTCLTSTSSEVPITTARPISCRQISASTAGERRS